MTETIWTIEGYPRNHHFIPAIENTFSPDGAMDNRKKVYYSWWRWSRSRVWALFETREVRDSEFDVILCLRGPLLASQHRKIERKRTFKALDSLSEWKSSLCLARFAKHAQKLYCLTQSRSQTTPRLLIDLFTDTAAILN